MSVTTGYYFPRLDMMSVSKPPKPKHGRVIAARRAYLGKSAMDVENETRGVINQKMVYRIEAGKPHPLDLDVKKFNALLEVLDWTAEQFARETGVELPEAFLEDSENVDPLTRFAPPPETWLHFPVMTSASAGTGDSEPLEDEVVSITASRLRARGARREDVMVVLVNGDCLVSQNIQTSRKGIAHGDYAFVHIGAKPSANDIVCLWDELDGQLILKYQAERQDPSRPDEIVLLDAKGRRYIRNTADLVYRGVVFYRSGDL